ncbi:pancreatic lipase-related protein 2-like [Patiria miniata]|uniref:Lipase domain-containing protein n=1 Tax=Patiria miniata TaxID=46514 RepID=A0A913ZWN9_PATMI|nr:pancreatic lipase-related protein 2-like [Patiria miniata]
MYLSLLFPTADDRLFECSCILDQLDPDHVCDETFEPVTYAGLGTFTADLQCHRRGFPPDNINDIGTRFYLYTRENPSADVELTEASGGKVPFSSARPTKFIIHGFQSNGKKSWVLEMKDELLKKGDFNVISVDWKDGADPSFLPDYCQARQNIRVVARQIVNLLQQMLNQYSDFDLADVHLIGHSLGGQMAGYVGQHMSGQIGRISGMDPAEPDFQGDEIDCRLDPSDAAFVDVIHASMFGIFQPVGHVDIYPNYGTDMPGCTSWAVPDIVEGYCGHKKSHEYFTDGINDDCNSLAYPCTWVTGQGQGCTYQGQPGVTSVQMGYHADQTPLSAYGLYVIMTNKESPYCAPNIIPSPN